MSIKHFARTKKNLNSHFFSAVRLFILSFFLLLSSPEFLSCSLSLPLESEIVVKFNSISKLKLFRFVCRNLFHSYKNNAERWSELIREKKNERIKGRRREKQFREREKKCNIVVI